MKAERRHELKENDLSHALSVARDYLDTNGTRIGMAVVVVGVVVAAVAFGIRSRAAASEDVWRRKAQLKFDDPQTGIESLEALASMTQGVADDRFVFSSLVDQGMNALRLAQQVDLPPDSRLNEMARGAFEQLLARFPDNPLALGLGNSGLASVEQNAFVLDRDPSHRQRAQGYLTAIISNPALAGTPFQRIALDRERWMDAAFDPVELIYATSRSADDPEAPQAAVPVAFPEPEITVEYADPVEGPDPLGPAEVNPVDDPTDFADDPEAESPPDAPGGAR